MTDNYKWQLKSSKVVIDSKFLHLEENSYELPNKQIVNEYYKFKERNAVNIIAFTPDNKVLMVKQYRAGIDKVILEFPAGYLEGKNDDYIERGKEELLEETGYASENWQDLGYVNPLPNRATNMLHCLLARDAKKVSDQKLDKTEFLSFEEVPLADVKRMILENKLTCAICIASFAKALLDLNKTIWLDVIISIDWRYV